jgi:SH3-like domain-containing protein
MLAHVEKGMFAEALDDIEKWRRIEDTPYLWVQTTIATIRSATGRTYLRKIACPQYGLLPL